MCSTNFRFFKLLHGRVCGVDFIIDGGGCGQSSSFFSGSPLLSSSSSFTPLLPHISMQSTLAPPHKTQHLMCLIAIFCIYGQILDDCKSLVVFSVAALPKIVSWFFFFQMKACHCSQFQYKIIPLHFLYKNNLPLKGIHIYTWLEESQHRTEAQSQTR